MNGKKTFKTMDRELSAICIRRGVNCELAKESLREIIGRHLIVTGQVKRIGRNFHMKKRRNYRNQIHDMFLSYIEYGSFRQTMASMVNGFGDWEIQYNRTVMLNRIKNKLNYEPTLP